MAGHHIRTCRTSVWFQKYLPIMYRRNYVQITGMKRMGYLLHRLLRRVGPPMMTDSHFD